jgi:ATP-binding cassette subfamily B protein RaxB
MNERVALQINPALQPNNRLPVILQGSENDCGLACLAMVSQYHHLNQPLSALKKQFPLPANGLSIKELVEIGEKIGLHLAPVKADFTDLKELTCPAILYWAKGHYVVLKNAKANEIAIHDPLSGPRKIKKHHAENQYSGVAIAIDKENDFLIPAGKKLSALDLFKDIAGSKHALMMIVFLALISQVLVGVQPFFLQFVLDEVVSKRDLDLLVILAIGFFLVAAAQLIVSIVRELFIIKISTVVRYSLNTRVLFHLIRLPFAYYHERNIGDIVTRFSVLGNIQNAIYQNAPKLLINFLLLLTSSAILITYSLPLAALAITSSLLCIVIRALFYPKRKALSAEMQVSSSNMSSNLINIIRSYRAIKIFQMETARADKWENAYLEYLTSNVKLESRSLYTSTLIEAVAKLDYLATICLGVVVILNDLMSTGMLMAFLSFKMTFSNSANESFEAIIKLKLMRVDLDRVEDIVLAKREELPLSSPYSTALDLRKAMEPCALELSNLAFKYAPERPYIFKDLNFSIKPGERVAIVGPSGCGKTTLLSCLIGILSPTAGAITVDGCNLSAYPNYRAILSVVFQDDMLLEGTIMENIACFSSKIDTEHAHFCANVANIHADIMRMPLGYNSPIGDLGSTFSGGQRQRIFIARALYKRPRLLIFDEATSQLDVANELLIIENLKQINCTQIYVTHRQEVARALDRVIDMRSLKDTPRKINAQG